MGRFEPRDYISHLPPVPAPRAVTFEPLDDTRYSIDAPHGEDEYNVRAWEAAIANARAQLEHTLLREVNLDLLAKFGPAAWRAHCADVEAMVARCGLGMWAGAWVWRGGLPLLCGVAKAGGIVRVSL